MNKKTVLVTGASRGIGRSIALTFAKHGYHVFLNCSRSVAELEEVKHEIETIPNGSCDIFIGDIGNSQFVSEMFEAIHQKCSSLDVLVNNAGIAHIGLLTDMADEEWNRLLQTNLSSVFYCSRAAVPNMVSKKSGKIINISSMWGSSGSSCEVAYSASKAGVDGFTKALAKELAPSGVTVNAIAPGVIDTDMLASFTKEDINVLCEQTPLGRIGKGIDVAKAALFLAGEGGDFITGQIINVNGGFVI